MYLFFPIYETKTLTGIHLESNTHPPSQRKNITYFSCIHTPYFIYAYMSTCVNSRKPDRRNTCGHVQFVLILNIHLILYTYVHMFNKNINDILSFWLGLILTMFIFSISLHKLHVQGKGSFLPVYKSYTHFVGLCAYC